jgi:hypothetical protein
VAVECRYSNRLKEKKSVKITLHIERHWFLALRNSRDRTSFSINGVVTLRYLHGKNKT